MVQEYSSFDIKKEMKETLDSKLEMKADKCNIVTRYFAARTNTRNAIELI